MKRLRMKDEIKAIELPKKMYGLKTTETQIRKIKRSNTKREEKHSKERKRVTSFNVKIYIRKRVASFNVKIYNLVIYEQDSTFGRHRHIHSSSSKCVHLIRIDSKRSLLIRNNIIINTKKSTVLPRAGPSEVDAELSS